MNVGNLENCLFSIVAEGSPQKCIVQCAFLLKWKHNGIIRRNYFKHQKRHNFDKGFKVTVVNRALPSLHGGSLKTTLIFLLSTTCILTHLHNFSFSRRLFLFRHERGGGEGGYCLHGSEMWFFLFDKLSYIVFLSLSIIKCKLFIIKLALITKDLFI